MMPASQEATTTCIALEATLRKTYRDVEKNLELPGVRPGERTNFEGNAVANSILLAIPDEEFAGLRDKLYHVDLPYYTVLHEPRQKLEHAFFLNSGMVSLVFNHERKGTAWKWA